MNQGTAFSAAFRMPSQNSKPLRNRTRELGSGTTWVVEFTTARGMELVSSESGGRSEPPYPKLVPSVRSCKADLFAKFPDRRNNVGLAPDSARTS